MTLRTVQYALALVQCRTLLFVFFSDAPPTEIYTLSLHDALPICLAAHAKILPGGPCHTDRSNRSRLSPRRRSLPGRSEEHTSELQSQFHIVCRLLLEKKNVTCTGAFL